MIDLPASGLFLLLQYFKRGYVLTILAYFFLPFHQYLTGEHLIEYDSCAIDIAFVIVVAIGAHQDFGGSVVLGSSVHSVHDIGGDFFGDSEVCYFEVSLLRD